MLSVKCPWPLLLKIGPNYSYATQLWLGWVTEQLSPSSSLFWVITTTLRDTREHCHPPITEDCSCKALKHPYPLHHCTMWTKTPMPYICHIPPCLPLISCINRSQMDLFQVHRGTVHSMGVRPRGLENLWTPRRQPRLLSPPTEQFVRAILITHHVRHLPGNGAAASAGRRKEIL